LVQEPPVGFTGGVKAVIVSRFDPGAGGEMLTTVPCWQDPPPIVGQNATFAGRVLFAAFQKPVPWIVTVALPVI
jgi:hypothetical protein